MSQQSGNGRAVTRVEFALSDGSYPFVSVSAAESCSVILEKCLPQTDDTYAEFFSVEGARPGRLVERIEDENGGTARVIECTSDGGLVEINVRDNCPVVSLADAGAVPQTARSVDGQGTIVADVPNQTDTAAVIDSFLTAHSDAELAAKKQRDSIVPLFGFQNYASHTEPLTDRQQEVLATAHEAGYYNWPRGATAADLAELLDISEPTLHKHLRAAEQKLVATMFACPHDERASASDS
ncbi:helix-turn-helix domain-containing protein [Haloarcula hispanica]|uniref:Helix-turn-helix domain-containing protein n=1 Tax=Haloarcula hispanica TaxID=51589 RepID=A0A482TFW7_HALHI|nr:helix-turn-helix domain-containing protein [Haloarcula hispanica]MCJ0620578.1 helix-turn-helix domain-containing protein [Haloarcula hispanica]RYJ10959.1 helix-turn-helix domain-containing protein [Haloarcula hispanica]